MQRRLLEGAGVVLVTAVEGLTYCQAGPRSKLASTAATTLLTTFKTSRVSADNRLTQLSRCSLNRLCLHTHSFHRTQRAPHLRRPACEPHIPSPMPACLWPTVPHGSQRVPHLLQRLFADPCIFVEARLPEPEPIQSLSPQALTCTPSPPTCLQNPITTHLPVP